MVDFIIIALILGIAAAIVFYLVRQKKQGVACIGCPHGKQCASHKKGEDHTSRCGGCSGSCGSCSRNCGCQSNCEDAADDSKKKGCRICNASALEFDLAV